MARAAILGLVAALCLVAQAALAQSPPAEPILRIETGLHNAQLVRLDTDDAGRHILTGSDDGTARLWDAATGEMIRTFRMPLGQGHQGRVFAVALSPDGKLAAAGGFTAYGQTANVFVFDTRTGRLVQRVPGLPAAVMDLAFSRDGRRLAIGIGGTNGIAIHETQGWARVATLSGPASAVYGLDWHPDGGLAAASYDGVLYRYGPNFREIARARVGSGALPYSVAFSPDGRQLAIGFSDWRPVEIRDPATLALVDSLTVNESMNAVAWSDDGRRLAAAGTSWVNRPDGWAFTLRLWPVGPETKVLDFAATKASIMDIAPLPGGHFAVGGAGPEILRLSPTGTVLWQHEQPMLDFSTLDRTHLRLRPDGRAVGMRGAQRDAITFDTTTRALGTGPIDWPAQRESAPGMVFSDWRDSEAPMLNGRPLGVLERFETARSISVAADGSFAVLGADWNIYAVTPDGQTRWRRTVSEVAWAVTLSEDGRVFVAAHADGTIRWYRASDGAEVLALYVHSDHQRWVAWTPSGFYDASPGGADLIGWHVNRGLDSVPDFFPAYVFRDRFYRPDIVAEILGTLDEGAAIAAAEAARKPQAAPAPAVPAPPPPAAPLAEVLPPLIRVIAPERDAEVSGDAVTLELDITTAPDAPLTDLRARVNGRAVPDARIEGARVTVSLPAIDDPEIYLTLLGQNRHGLGEPVDLRLTRASPAVPEPAALRPMLYVLAIGVSEYQDESLRLDYAAKDAEDIAALFEAQVGPLYRGVEVQLVTDEDATFAGVRAGLGWLRREMTDLDTALIFIAGHGMNDNNGDLFFLTHESEVDALFETAVEATMFTDTIQRLPGRVIYLMDTCHSGNLEFVQRGGTRIDLNRHLHDLRAATGAVVFSSATGSQYALESSAWGNGAFTLAVIEGLEGGADYNTDRAVSVNELNLYVTQRVKELTNNRQTPVLRLPGEVRDFPVAALR